MTDKELSFAFHINTPNNEDVDPLIYNGWLAVADGMGGTGCMKHIVDDKFRTDLSTLLQYFLPEIKQYNGEAITVKSIDGECSDYEYLSKIFEPCLKNSSNTSALWASRIAMSRFLCAIKYYDIDCLDDLKSNDYFKNLEQHISKSLKKAKDGLHLTVNSPYLSVTPTTFAAIHYCHLNDENCIVHAVWAGDSRCYLLDANGLRRLSVDDENESKQLTNCFSADSEAALHSRKYILQQPFVLLCASDGFFDAYDSTNLSVEARLLKDIFNCNSADELHNALVERYANNLSDDTSVAFVPVGFENYEQIKERLANRYKKVNELYERYCKYSSILSLIDRPEHLVTTSICDRFETKFSAIIKLLVGAYYDGQEDILLTQSWRDIIKNSEAECAQAIELRVKERQDALKQEVLERIFSQTDCLYLKKITHLNNKLVKIITGFQNACAGMEAVKKEQRQNEQKGRDLAEKKKALCGEIWAEQERLLKAFDYLISVSKNSTDEEAGQSLQKQNSGKKHSKIALIKNLSEISEIECSFANDAPFDDDSKPKSIYKSLVSKINKYYGHKKSYDNECQALNKKIRETTREHQRAYKYIVDNIDQLLACRINIFTDEFIAEFDMDTIMSDAAIKDELRGYVEKMLVERYAKDAGLINETLEVYKQHSRDKSCIDSLFSANKLSDFRKYYEYKSQSQLPEFVQYREDISAYEQEMDRVIEES